MIYPSIALFARSSVLGLAPVIFGTFDLLNVFKKNPDALKTAMVQGGINMTVDGVYSVLSYMQYKHYPIP
jgi:hypothetical protein